LAKNELKAKSKFVSMLN